MGSLRRLRDAVARLRFRLWVARFRARLRWHGARLLLDAPDGARFTTPPRFRVLPRGDGGATFRLRLGREVDLGRDVTLDVWAGGDNELVIEDGAYLMANVRLQLRGGRIRLGPRSHLRDSVVVKSAGDVSIGEDVTVSWGTVVHCDGRVRLGDRSSAAEHVSFVDSDHAADGSEVFHLHQALRVGEVDIGDNTIVLAGARVLRDAHVGANAMVAAGAVVRGGTYADGWLLAGVPAVEKQPLPALPVGR